MTSTPSTHERAADAFADAVHERFGDAVDSIVLYGSVARGEAHGVTSDVDLLVVLRDDVDGSGYEERIRTLAYDIELEYGVVLSLIVTTQAEFERESGRPFFQHVRQDAQTLYG